MRLAQKFGAQESAGPPMELGAREGNDIHPIFQVNMSTLPIPSIGGMELAFVRGADSRKCVTETVVPSVTKYTDSQLVNILSFCGLSPVDRDNLPKIWTNLQTTKDWNRASTK